MVITTLLRLLKSVTGLNNSAQQYLTMKKIIELVIFVLVVSNLFGQDSTQLINKWKLTKYEAFEKAKNSPAYFLSDEEAIKKYNATVKFLLDSVYYDFQSDKTLIYVDLENNKPIKRRAKWSLRKDELLIVELERPYSRKAKIIRLTDKELIFSPIIDGEVGDSPMIFTAKSSLK